MAASPAEVALEYWNQSPSYIPEVKKEKVNKKKIEVVPDNGARKLTKSNLFKEILAMLLIGAFMVGLIGLNAYKSSIKYSINKLEAENAKLSNKVVVLQSQVDGGNSMEIIEGVATSQLGMSYANAQQCVYVTISENDTNLAEIIKQKAYS